MPPNEQSKEGTGEAQDAPPNGNAVSSGGARAASIGGAPTAPDPSGATVKSAQKADAAAATVPKGHFLWNVFFFILLVISATIWFLRHVQYFFLGAAVGGSLLITLAVVQFAYGAFKWSAEKEVKTLPEKLLGAWWSRRALVALLAVSVILNVFTSSLYIQYQSTEDSKACTVKITNAVTGERFVGPLTVTADNEIAGGPFLFRFRPVKLRFELVEPRGYEDKIESFYFPYRILLRAPGEFLPKKFHILRVVFGPRLWNNLAEPGDNSPVSYDLEISLGSKTKQVIDVRRQSLYFGADEADLDYVCGKEDSSRRGEDFRRGLAAIEMPDAMQQSLIQQWERSRRLVATEEHDPKEPVLLALRRHGSDARLAGAETVMTSDTIQTIVLEMP